MRRVDLTGQRFGKLLVVSFSNSSGRRYFWNCNCDCGVSTKVDASNLRGGNSKACGKCRKPPVGNLKHGASVTPVADRTYKSWRAMRARSRNRPGYVGIYIDPKWDDFAAFRADMGERPVGTSIDRVDGRQGYFKENCRWATPLQQTRNRRVARTFTWGGETKTIMEWAVAMGTNYGSMLYRVNKYKSVRLPDGG